MSRPGQTQPRWAEFGSTSVEVGHEVVPTLGQIWPTSAKCALLSTLARLRTSIDLSPILARPSVCVSECRPSKPLETTGGDPSSLPSADVRMVAKATFRSRSTSKVRCSSSGARTLRFCSLCVAAARLTGLHVPLRSVGKRDIISLCTARRITSVRFAEQEPPWFNSVPQSALDCIARL